MGLPPWRRWLYARHADKVRARRTREELMLRGVRIEPDEYLAFLLAEGVPPDEAEKRAGEHAANLLRADAARREREEG